MPEYSSPSFEFLTAQGLNLQAVFDLDRLPTDIYDALAKQCGVLEHYRQLMLIGHAGGALWQSLRAVDISSDDPVDDYSLRVVDDFFKMNMADTDYRVLYPGETHIALQQLGGLAGWHHPSPFWLGINKTWGSWFAYRLVVLSNSTLAPTAKIESASPCDDCVVRACVSACPANAMDNGDFDLKKCSRYRMNKNSACGYQCLARKACPVGKEHQYSPEQSKYHYSISLKTMLESKLLE